MMDMQQKHYYDTTQPRAGITPDVVEVLTATANELQRTRKGKKQAPPGLATVEELENFAQLAKQPLHATRSAGITSIAISPASATTCATAGADGNVVVFDSQAKRIMQKISGHSKKVTDVAYLDATTLVTGGVDKTVRLWGADGEGMFYEAASFTDHTGEVVGVDVHPSGKYIVSASADKTWCLYDEDMCITQVGGLWCVVCNIGCQSWCCCLSPPLFFPVLNISSCQNTCCERPFTR